MSDRRSWHVSQKLPSAKIILPQFRSLVLLNSGSSSYKLLCELYHRKQPKDHGSIHLLLMPRLYSSNLRPLVRIALRRQVGVCR